MIDLSDNEIVCLPSNLSMMSPIHELNLTGNPIDNIEQAADAIYSIGPTISNLGINLHEEQQVGYLLKTVETLVVLNGIEVERDALFDSSNQEEEPSESENE